MTPERQFAAFLANYTPEVQKIAKVAIAKVRERLPGAFELVYDNYNALVIGFGPSEKTSEAILSVAMYPRWANLFFLKGVSLPDPHGILKGSGSTVRHILLERGDEIDDPRVAALIDLAVSRAAKPFPAKRTMIIKSQSAKQRPRRPA